MAWPSRPIYLNSGRAGASNSAAGDTMAPAIDPADVQLTFGSKAIRTVINPQAEQVIRDNVAAGDSSSCTITSTLRLPADQARAMFNNLESFGVAKQRALYGAPGNKVIDTYVASKAAGKTAAQIQVDMTGTINQDPYNVSHHCFDPAKLCVVDIDPNTIVNGAAFVAAVKADKRVSKFFFPPQDPAFHLEMPVTSGSG